MISWDSSTLSDCIVSYFSLCQSPVNLLERLSMRAIRNHIVWLSGGSFVLFDSCKDVLKKTFKVCNI